MVGVLATGGAAFAANTSVLGSIIPSFQRSSTLAVAETIVPFIDLSIEPVAIGGAVVVNTTVFPAVTTSTTLVPAPSKFAYNISGVGIVTLKQNFASLEVVSVKPVSGWTYVAENESVTRVEIEFENRTKGVEFRAQLLDGRIITAVTVEEKTDDERDDADSSVSKSFGDDGSDSDNSGSSDTGSDSSDDDEEDDDDDEEDEEDD